MSIITKIIYDDIIDLICFRTIYEDKHFLFEDDSYPYFYKEEIDMEGKIIRFSVDGMHHLKLFIVKNMKAILLQDYVHQTNREEATYLKLKYL